MGDNFFYGQSLSKTLKLSTNLKKGAKILLHKVNKPERYGVAKLKNRKVVSLIEKPEKFVSDLAVTGLYFFDNKVIEYTKKLCTENCPYFKENYFAFCLK